MNLLIYTKKLKIYWFFLFLAFLVGGLGIYLKTTYGIGSLVFIIFTTLTLFLKKTKILFPKYFFIYALFIVLLFTSLLWSFDKNSSFYHSMLFLSSLFIWLYTYNFREKLTKDFDKLIILVSILFGISFIFYKILGRTYIISRGLCFPSSPYHNHLGDLWAVTLTLVLSKTKKGNLYKNLPIFIIGIFFLLLSSSRSAILALSSGILFLISKNIKLKYLFKNKPSLVIVSLLFFSFLFISGGISKSTFGTRPYYLQSIKGLLDKPFGIGLGNFGFFSGYFSDFWWGKGQYSSVTHNIFLEILSGIGIFSVIFYFWFIKILKNIILNNNSLEDLGYRAAFIVLSVNFFFDYTYFVPTMLWLWFVFLGLSQAKT